MQTVNFFMPVEIPTGHPTHILEAAFLGRAIIENEPSDGFTADGITASIQDLFFLADTTKPTETAERVELPDPYTAEGRMFKSRLETAAKEAFWNMEYGATECALPDEYTPKPGDSAAGNPRRMAAPGAGTGNRQGAGMAPAGVVHSTKRILIIHKPLYNNGI